MARSIRKRANGEGSRPFKRKDGRWQAGITERTPDGPKRRWFYGKSAKEAGDKLKEALRRREDGLPVVEDRRILGDYLSSWLEGARPGLSPSSYERYEMLIRIHIKPKLGMVPLAKLTPEQIQQHYARELAAGLSPSSVRGQYAVFHQALEQAMVWRLIPRNPADFVKPPRLNKRESAWLSDVQARQLLAAARGEPLEPLWWLALTTAMRQGELLALRWRDLDLDGGAVIVRANINRQGEVGETKNHRQRRIDLIAPVVALLREQPRRGVGDAFVFPSPVRANRPISSWAANDALARLLGRAELPSVTFHALRHSCASLLLSLGVPVPVVSQILGHATATQTLGTYSHLAPTAQGEAVREMERFFGR